MALKIRRTGDADYNRNIKALIFGEPGAGKALANGSGVVTPEGFVPIENLTVGDLVGSPSGWATVEGVFPQGIRRLYQVLFSDGSRVTCDGSHLWNVQSQNDRKRNPDSWLTLTLDEINDRGIRLEDGTRKWYVPTTKPVAYSHKNYVIDPYTLGALLGDGSFRTETLMFSTADAEIFDHMDLQGLEIRHASGYDYSLCIPYSGSRLDSANRMKAELQHLGLWGLKSQEKFIPKVYMEGSPEQRLALLRGLMDTDGTCSKGRASFSSSSKMLANQMADLVKSLGGVTGSRAKGVTIKATEYLPSYRVSVSLEECPFLLSRKSSEWIPSPVFRSISSVQEIEEGEATCIKIDSEDGLFLTEGYVVTHNTLMSSTFPDPFYVVADPGLMSIADRHLPYVEIESSTDLLGIKNMLDQDADTRKQLLGFPIRTVVIDTIDEVQKILIAERLKSEKKEAMTLPDWGWLSEQMQAIIRGFRNLDMHVVFTCHLKEVSDGDTGRVYHKPGLQGGIADQIPGYVDLSLAIVPTIETVIENNETKKVQKRYLHSFPTASMGFLKDRSGKLPQVLEVNFEDDFERINALVYANVDKLPESTVTEIEEPGDVTPSLPSSEPRVEVTPAAPEPAKQPAKKVAKAVKKAAANAEDSKPEPVKQETPAAPVDGYKYVTADGTEVISRNKLPEGVVPILRGFDTNFFCEETGNEVEDENQADLSRIRFRRILCKAAHEELKR